MHWPNLDQLSPHDEVKFVIQDRADFDYAADVVDRYALDERARRGAVLAGARRAGAARAGAWILERGLPARLQLQAHKYIWTPETRGV